MTYITSCCQVLLFIGIGAMIDFGPLLANPKLFLCGAAAQAGILRPALRNSERRSGHFRHSQSGLAARTCSMLVYYVFEDSVGEDHSGYFWYNCETGAVDGILEMDSR